MASSISFWSLYLKDANVSSRLIKKVLSESDRSVFLSNGFLTLKSGLSFPSFNSHKFLYIGATAPFIT